MALIISMLEIFSFKSLIIGPKLTITSSLLASFTFNHSPKLNDKASLFAELIFAFGKRMANAP